MVVERFLARDLIAEVLTTDAAEVLGTPVTGITGESDTELFTKTAHGFVNGDVIRFSALTGGSGIVVGEDYYVISAAANTFKLSEVFGGESIDFISDVTAGTASTVTNPNDVFTVIRGLNSLTHSPSTERADSTGFDSGGRSEHLVAQRGESWALQGYKLIDPATGAGDPGQEAVEALGRLIGPAALGTFRIRQPSGAGGFLFRASVELTLPGGGNNDIAAWNVGLEVSGGVSVVDL